MSILIDQLLNNSQNEHANFHGDSLWYMAKPLNYSPEYSPFLKRVKDAWRVLRGSSIAVHYKEDEVNNG